jgi:hypothetical protein
VRQPSSLFLLLAAALLSSIFGEATTDISEWIVCLTSEDICDQRNKRDAQMLATFVSTVCAVLIASLVGQSYYGETEKRTTGLIVGAMVGALFSLFKSSVGDKGYPEPSALAGPLIIYFAVSCLVFFPLVFHRTSEEPISSTTVFRKLSQGTLALVVGLFLGGLYQWFADFFWMEPSTDGSSSKFVLATVVPVAATACIGAMVIPPTPWGRAGIISWLVFSISISVAYFRLIYFPEHSNKWISLANLNSFEVGVRYCLIMVSGILAIGLVCLIWPKRPDLRRTFLIGGLAVGLVSWSSHGIGASWVEPGVRGTEVLRAGTPIAIALVHSLGVVLGISVALIAAPSVRLLGRRVNVGQGL